MNTDHEDLKDRFEAVYRAVVRLTAAYDPTAPEETANLVADLAIAAGINGQNEAQAIMRSWNVPIHSSEGERFLQVMSVRGQRL